eukprot:6459177-Amphidinium_carterae.1
MGNASSQLFIEGLKNNCPTFWIRHAFGGMAWGGHNVSQYNCKVCSLWLRKKQQEPQILAHRCTIPDMLFFSKTIHRTHFATGKSLEHCAVTNVRNRDYNPSPSKQ